MKKILTLVALMVTFVVGANAARSIHLKAISNVPNNDTIIIDSVNKVEYLFQYGFVNKGPDAIQTGDTLRFRNAYNSGFYFISDDDYLVDDTIAWFNDTTSIVNGPVSGTYQWCDSAWAVSHVTADAITDPTPGKDCRSVFILNRNGQTGISSVNFKKSVLNVFPNPANNQISFTNEFTATAIAIVKVTDLTGRVVKTINLGKQNAGTKTYSVDIADLNNGMYYIELITEDVRSISKFTKN